jgi:hypothetical protein
MFTITLSESDSDRWTSDGPDGDDFRRAVRTGVVVLYRYATDGEEIHTAAERQESAYPSLEDARTRVAELLVDGGASEAAELADHRWPGVAEDLDIEAYHDYPRQHPRAHGCGGWAIRRPRRGETIEIHSADGVTLDAWEAP